MGSSVPRPSLPVRRTMVRPTPSSSKFGETPATAHVVARHPAVHRVPLNREVSA